MRRRIAHGLMIGLMIIGLRAAQGPNNSEASSAPTSPPQNKPEIRKQVGKGQPYQVGTASWYGEYFEGKPTASGEDYDMYDMTAAHHTLPLGSYVRVTNLHNGKAVVVKVTTGVRSCLAGLSTCPMEPPKLCSSNTKGCNGFVWI